jgi:hypothetical protein
LCRFKNDVYWIHPVATGEIQLIFILAKRLNAMTYLDVVFHYVSLPGENELRAIDGVREVYGIRSVHFNEKDGTVRVGYDASRLRQDAVAKLLRQAGIDVGGAVALA